MNTKRFTPLSAFVLLSLLIQACSVSFSTANFGDTFMSMDPDGDKRTYAYDQDDVFYAIADLANAPDDTTVRAVWFAVEADGVAPNTQLEDVSTSSSSTRLTFNLANATNMLWPTGKYRVDLYLNGKLETDLEFEVESLPVAIPTTSPPTVTLQPTPESATATPQPTAEPVSQLVTFAGDGFTLGLPAGFDTGGVLTLALDESVYARDGYTNMTVSSFPNSANQSLDQIVEETITQYSTIPGATYLAQTRMDHPDYEMAGLALSVEAEGASEAIMVIQYITIVDGQVWVLSYGTTESSFSNWQDLFDESALSLQIN